MFAFTCFEILQFKWRLVLSLAKRGTKNERVKYSEKIQQIILVLLELLQKCLTYKLKRFQMGFFGLFDHFGTGESEKRGFSIPITSQTSNSNN